MCPSMPASKQRSRSPFIACAVSPTIGIWLLTHLFFLRRELVHRRPAEVDAGRLLEGVGDRERCLEAGTDGHIAKPLQPGGLFETVEREGEPRTE